VAAVVPESRKQLSAGHYCGAIVTLTTAASCKSLTLDESVLKQLVDLGLNLPWAVKFRSLSRKSAIYVPRSRSRSSCGRSSSAHAALAKGARSGHAAWVLAAPSPALGTRVQSRPDKEG
jgi:hypothetical protein